MKNNNKKPFFYQSRNGTEFSCKAADFSYLIEVKRKPENLNSFMTDIAEMAAMHALEVRPTLNEFSGYDCLHFAIK